MKHFATAALAASALGLGITGAGAADMPLKAPPAPLVAPFSWTGFYIGVNIGAVRGNADIDTICPGAITVAACPILFPPFETNTVIPGIGPILLIVPAAAGSLPGGSVNDTSFMGGGQAGFNWQVNQFVLGLEGDVDATHIRASLTRNAVPPAGAAAGFFGNVAATSTFDNDWMASIRGRLGIAFGRTLIYGTGGVAFANSSLNTSFTYTPPGNALPAFLFPGPTGANSSHNLTGWTAGGGVEWMFTDALSLGAEYRHSDFGRENYLLGADVNAPATPIATSVKYTADQVTVRLNWHFH